MIYSDLEDNSPEGVLAHLVNIRHICPTAPDTIRSYPFVKTDPFIMEESPNVFFAGNCEKYGQKLMMGDAGKAIKVIAVPKFREKKSIVLLDLESMQSYEFKFDMGTVMRAEQEME